MDAGFPATADTWLLQAQAIAPCPAGPCVCTDARRLLPDWRAARLSARKSQEWRPPRCSDHRLDGSKSRLECCKRFGIHRHALSGGKSAPTGRGNHGGVVCAKAHRRNAHGNF